jgi:hypothetical protein
MAYQKYITDEFLNIARGTVRGSSVVNIFGYGVSIGATFIPAWEQSGGYTYPTSNLVMGFVSADASDTDITIKIEGLDSDYNQISEVVDMDGTNEVFTDNGYFRINNIVTLTGNANGDITVANTGTTYGFVNAGEGKNQASIFTVPAGHSFYLYRINAFASNATSGTAAVFRNFVNGGGTNTSFRVGQTVFQNDLEIQRRAPFKYGEKSDIQLQIRKLNGPNIIGGLFGEGILVDER